MRTSLSTVCILLSAAVLAHTPRLLLHQERSSANPETESAVNVLHVLERELDDSGKAMPVLYSPKSRAVAVALAEGRLKAAPASPSRAELLDIAKALECNYVLVIAAQVVGNAVQVVAELLRPGSKEPKWGPSHQEVSAATPSRLDLEMAAASAARTIALQLLTGPLLKEESRPPLPPIEHGTGTGTTTAPAVRENKPLKAAEAALEKGLLPEAASLLRTAVDRDPLSPSIRATLCSVYGALGMHDLAVSEVLRALSLIGADPALELTYARALMNAGRLRESEVAYREFLEKHKDSAEAMVGLAEVLVARLLPVEAEQLYRRAKELRPRDPEIAWGLSEVLAMQADYVASLKERDTAVALGMASDPKAAERRYNRLASLLDRVAAQLGADIEELHAEAVRLQGTEPFDLNARIAIILGRTNDFCSYLDQLEPPARHRQSHVRRLLGMNLMSQAILAIKRGVEQKDRSALEEAVLTRSEAMRELLEAQKAFREEQAAEKAETTATSGSGREKSPYPDR